MCFDVVSMPPEVEHSNTKHNMLLLSALPPSPSPPPSPKPHPPPLTPDHAL
jgi:hypothetical protein